MARKLVHVRSVGLVLALTVATLVGGAHNALGAVAPQWHAPREVGPRLAPSAIGCTETLCVAAMGYDIFTSRNGAPFQLAQSAVTTSPLIALWCDRTGSSCVVVTVDGSVATTADNGATWSNTPSTSTYTTAMAAVSRNSAATDLQCTPSVGCVLAIPLADDGGNDAIPVFYAPFNGATLGTWRVATSLDLPESQVSCSGTGLCILTKTDGAAIRSTDGGASWTAIDNAELLAAGPNDPALAAQVSVSCVPGTTTCLLDDAWGSFVYNSTLFKTTDGGVTWTTVSTTQGESADYALACASVDLCGKIDVNALAENPTQRFILRRSTDLGATWSAGTTVLASRLSCPSPTLCVATLDYSVAAALSRTVDVTSVLKVAASSNLTNWHDITPSGVLNAGPVQCASATTCVVVTSEMSGTSLRRSSDGGMSWHLGGKVPSSIKVGTSPVAACSATACTVVGATKTTPSRPMLVVSRNEGDTWSTVTRTQNVGGLLAITCRNLQCVAVGGSSKGPILVETSSNGGQTWGSVLPATAPKGVLSAVSCATTTRCVAVGSASGHPMAVTTTDGKLWKVHTSTVRGALFEVSCAGTQCLSTGKWANGLGLVTKVDALGLTVTNTLDAEMNWSGCIGSTCFIGTQGESPSGSQAKVRSTTDFGHTLKAVQPSALQRLAGTSWMSKIVVAPPSCWSATSCAQGASDGSVATYFA